MARTTNHHSAFSLGLAAAALAAMLAGALPTSAAQDADENPAPAEVGRVDMFLDMHPGITASLMNNPGLIRNPQYLAKHPALSAFLSDHPRIGEDLREHPGRFMHEEKRYDLVESQSAARPRLSPATKATAAEFDSFLDNNPQIERQLARHPELAANARYLKAHPALQNYLQNHPDVRQSMDANPARFMKVEQYYEASGADITRAEVTTFDAFLDSNPAIARDLSRNPALIDNPAYVARHPELQKLLSQNPGIRGESKENPQTLSMAVARYDRLTGTPEAVRPASVTVAARDRSGIGSVAAFDGFLDRNPDIAEQLRAHPEMIASAEFRTANPTLATFLNTHPAVANQISKNPASFMKSLSRFDKHETPAQERREERMNRHAPVIPKPGH